MKNPRLHLFALAALVSSALPAHAIILTSTTTLPTMEGGTGSQTDFYFLDPGNGSDTNTQQNIGLFTFANPTAVPSLLGLQVNIALWNLDTNSPGSNNFGNIDLMLNGIDTGIQLNNFTQSTTQATVTGIDAATGAAIYASFESGGYSYSLPSAGPSTFTNHTSTQGPNGTYLQVNDSGVSNFSGLDNPLYSATATTSAGQLVAGLILTGDSHGYSGASNGGNNFQIRGGTATLEVSNFAIPTGSSPVPFEPSQALGFLLIALFIGLWQLPQAREQMKKLLVPAGV